MSDYQLTWITDHLAVGHAPMSYEDLDLIRAEGIDAIVNLCGEFCDLHEIEENSGFEVFYLPIPDECAPDMEEMEKALAWLDEAIYLGQKGSGPLPPRYRPSGSRSCGSSPSSGKLHSCCFNSP